MLSSDHSPSVPELKLFEEGDFLRAWGGISSLQVNLFFYPFLSDAVRDYLVQLIISSLHPNVILLLI